MNRRSFLGWLGGGAAAATVAIYADDVPLPHPAANPIQTKDDAKATPAQSFILKNEGQTPMVISYVRDSPRMAVTEDRLRNSERYGKFSDGRRSEAILLPGEELRVTAIVMKV